MNCKQGDLVVVIAAGVEARNLLGWIFTVTEYVKMYGMDAWIPSIPLYNTLGIQLAFVEDSCLKPIKGEPKVFKEEKEKELVC